MPANSRPDVQADRITDALRAVDAHLAESDLSLDLVSRAVGVSPSYLSHLFHARVGVCFRTYVRSRRLDRAKELLGTTDLPIKEVAFAVGYRHVSDFTRHVKAAFGLPPARLRWLAQLSARVTNSESQQRMGS